VVLYTKLIYAIIPLLKAALLYTLNPGDVRYHGDGTTPPLGSEQQCEDRWALETIARSLALHQDEL